MYLEQFQAEIELLWRQNITSIACQSIEKKYRAHLRSLEGTTSKLNYFESRAKVRAPTELIAYINTALEDGIETFKLAKLHEM